MGWTDDGLAPAPAPASRTWVDVDGTGFVAAARRYLGTAYRLGGTTADGIDCSGLVQRALREAAHGLVPRHTRDQLAIGPAEGPGDDIAGTWIFVWSSAEAPGHVGIATGDGRVVHASRHRGVVEDTRREFLAESGHVRHVAWTRVCALQTRLVGHRTLDEVFTLGPRDHPG
jgi:cell wall-associated NlpC family hydrolase